MTEIPTDSPRAFAVHLYNRSIELLRADPATSFRCIVNATECDPTFAMAWLHLGNMLGDARNRETAVAAWRRGWRHAGEDIGTKQGIALNIGHALMNMGALDEAEFWTDEAIRLHGRHPDAVDKRLAAYALCNRSLLYAHRWLDGASLVDARRGFELFADPKTELGLAFAHLFSGHYAEGLKHFEARFDETLPQYHNLPYERWKGDHVETLLVLNEMGLGDTLSFARFIKPAAMKVENLIFIVQPELVRLLSRALSHIPNVEVRPQNHELQTAAVWCPAFGLPLALNLGTKNIRNASWAGVHPAPVENLSWKNKDARLHVAIAWAGAPGNDIDRHRSIPVTAFLPLHEIDGIQLYSIQVGPRARELHDTGGAAIIRDLSVWIRDAGDTAGILAEMDCAVVCESFVGHLAGAMDKECFLLCSMLGRDWRSAPALGDQVLWYDKTKVFRQDQDCSWAPVIRRVVEALRERA